MEAAVASVCDVCGKGPGFGNNVSHSHVRTRRRWNPNIQTVRAIVAGTPKRLHEGGQGSSIGELCAQKARPEISLPYVSRGDDPPEPPDVRRKAPHGERG